MSSRRTFPRADWLEVVVRDERVDQHALKVAAVFCTDASGTGVVELGRRLLGVRARMSAHTTVDKAIASLAELEYLSGDDTRGRGQRRRLQLRFPPEATQSGAAPEVGLPGSPLVHAENVSRAAEVGHKWATSGPPRWPTYPVPSTHKELAAAAESALATDELAEVLAPLEALDGHVLDGRGRELVAVAYLEDPAGAEALVRRYVSRRQARALRSGIGALVRAVGRGEHREAVELDRATHSAAERSAARRAPCPECGVGDGRHDIDCPTLVDDPWLEAECIVCHASYFLDALHPECLRCPACVAGVAA